MVQKDYWEGYPTNEFIIMEEERAPYLYGLHHWALYFIAKVITCVFQLLCWDKKHKSNGCLEVKEVDDVIDVQTQIFRDFD